MSHLYRNLPAVHSVLNHPDVGPLFRTLSRTQLTSCIRQALRNVRAKIETIQETSTEALLRDVLQQTQIQAEELLQQRSNRVINATGIVLHTNLGRAALSQSAIDRLLQAARATNVELDLVSGSRSRRGAYAERLLRDVTGAEAALIVNNCAAATMLALQGVATGKEVIISRGQLVEIGGGFRLPDVFEAAGVILREVGTSNRTQLADYERAIGANTGAILRVHRSNFRVSGFVSEPSAAELVHLATQHQLPMIDDLGSGCLTSLQPLELDEPDVAASLNAAAELVLFSGDKLLGGPQAGILLGQTAWIDRLRRHPLARAMRVGKLTLAALEATLEDHLAGQPFETVPVLAMLAATARSIEQRCTAIVGGLTDADDSRTSDSPQLNVIACQSEVGGGSLADQELPSFAVQIRGPRPDDLSQALRTGPEHVLSRIEQNAVLLDLRSVQPDDDALLMSALGRCLRDIKGSNT